MMTMRIKGKESSPEKSTLKENGPAKSGPIKCSQGKIKSENIIPSKRRREE